MSRYPTRFQSTALRAVARASRAATAARAHRQRLEPEYRRAVAAEERWTERRRREIVKARALGCSLREIADAADLHFAHVSRIERGERT